MGSCQYITNIPNLSGLQHLKELDLQSCKNLIEIHHSVGNLAKLQYLNVENCGRLKIFPRCIKLPFLEILHLNNCSSLTYFPDVLEKMKIRYLQLVGTGIEKLPGSICNLTRLRRLFINRHQGVTELPISIFLLPELEVIDAKRCGKWLSSNPNEAIEEEIWPMLCPNIFAIYLQECNISDELLRTYLTRFINVKHLDLTGNNFTILPAWIKECQYLRHLILNDCKHLREVEGIPPKTEYLEAINCLSLSSESRSLLLSEELLRAAVIRQSDNIVFKTFFCVPLTCIPDWFDHRSKGASISFWFRNCFPPLCLCLVFKSMDDVYDNCHVTTSVCINDKEVYWNELWNRDAPNVDHILVYDLKENHISWDKMGQACRKSKWNHVKWDKMFVSE